MAERITRELIAEKAIVHDTLALLPPHAVDRNFELPVGLYVAMATLFFGFLAVMTVGFGNPGLILPMAINVVFVTMFFAVPALWQGMKPDHPQRPIAWAKFRREGIMTPFGRTTAGAATVQVLILPALIFAFGVAVVTIVAFVR
jgi:hypothetical protein